MQLNSVKNKFFILVNLILIGILSGCAVPKKSILSNSIENAVGDYFNPQINRCRGFAEDVQRDFRDAMFNQVFELLANGSEKDTIFLYSTIGNQSFDMRDSICWVAWAKGKPYYRLAGTEVVKIREYTDPPLSFTERNLIEKWDTETINSESYRLRLRHNVVVPIYRIICRVIISNGNLLSSEAFLYELTDFDNTTEGLPVIYEG